MDRICDPPSMKSHQGQMAVPCDTFAAAPTTTLLQKHLRWALLRRIQSVAGVQEVFPTKLEIW